MSSFGRIISSIFSISIILASVGCNKDSCGYFGDADDLKLSYYSYECDGNGVRNGAARVDYIPLSDVILAYEWDIDGSTSVDEFINLKGNGPMSGFVRVSNTRDGCFIYKNVDMLFNMPHGTIGNKVWKDNGTIPGMHDSSDEPAENVRVDLLDSNRELIDLQTTDASGYYLFKHLPDGEYIIKVHRPLGYSFCPRNLNDDKTEDSDVDSEGYSDLITLTECEVNLTIDAGLIQ